MNLKAKTRQEIAIEYAISVKTLNRWFKRENIKIPQGLIDPYHQRIIYETFGIPKSFNVA
jgi:hypothetical protein